MARQKASTTKYPASSGSPNKPKRKARVSTAKELPSLHTVHQIKEAGKQTHLRAAKTRATYFRHVRQAHSWLGSHFLAEGTPSALSHAVDNSEVYSDPNFKNAFECVPNQCSDKALALYLSWKGFQENCSQSTIDGIRAAFKMLWDEVEGATFRGRWHHDDARHQWEGNLVLSAEVDDIVASIRHKVNSEGAERTHSGAMKKEYMDRILTWSESLCPLDVPLHNKAKLTITRHLGYLACGAVAFTLWTRKVLANYELVKLKRGDVQLDGTEHALTINELNTYFEIHLRNRKGWQKKLDKGMREADLRSNHYKIYPCPNMGKACDAFLHLVFWIRWVELVHLDRPMADEDFLFPTIGVNGVLQPGEPLSHDMVQKWINEAVVGSRIPGTFSTHCYHRGGAQYRFMFAPLGQRWTLARVQWWGGWAEGEHRDTLMRYLLDELHCYENDHSDALRPVSHEADGSFAGEAALARPASTEALNMAHASLTADVASLHSTVKEVHQQLSDMSNLVVKALTSPSTYLARPETVLHQVMPVIGESINAITILLRQLTSCTYQSTIVQPSDIDISISTSLPPHVRPQRTSTHPSVPLRIPNVPVLHVNGTRMPKSDSWRDVVRHWTEGEPRLGLYVPLKDWPHHHRNGKHGRQFNTKHHQRGVIATEFLNEFQGDKEAFLKAYGSAASLGHTKLLKAILDARKRHPRDGERHRHLADEVHDIPSMGRSSNDQQ
ncbi:hypothetical protein M404DRAFT_160167 [Pisolithus tinctorius Marx 270]|uniref:Ndc10 domain-containing protein n=1 Tax=Pisolithus tinctorius Marx 270 TaxID=870435 RepID=A0A0C3NQG2_PISTI|nr:hypothetical protein M404DRAFT_160167 [Pisolithus tinctorius Marx 270]